MSGGDGGTGAGLDRWRGRVALVTGASSGIGEAVARRLAGAGLRVALAARRRERLDALARGLEGEGAEVLVHPTDLRDEGAIHDLFGAIRGRWGGVDVLVNNAGLGHDASPLTGATDAWREMFEVNVLALAVCTREAVRDMRRAGDDGAERGGHVFHVGSLSGHRVPSAGGAVYAATKHAVRALTEGHRLELRALGSGVRVTAVSPGFVETEFAAKYHDSAAKARETYGRFQVLTPGDVADAVVWALGQPLHAEVHDILLRPTAQRS